MVDKEQGTRKFCVKIDGQACKDCGYCIEVCPKNIFSQADYFNDRGYKPVQVEYAAKCIGCRLCFFACPDFAIEIEEDRAEEDSNEKNI